MHKLFETKINPEIVWGIPEPNAHSYDRIQDGQKSAPSNNLTFQPPNSLGDTSVAVNL